MPKLPKKRGGRAMKRYDENFKIEALKLSDEIGVKKACEQLNVNYGTLAGWRKQRVKKNKEGKSTIAMMQSKSKTSNHPAVSSPYSNSAILLSVNRNDENNQMSGRA